jgi:hypothetical protein
LESLHGRPVLVEGYLEQHIGILEEALFQTNDHKLAALEEATNHQADVLGVTQVKSRIDLIKDVHWRWVVLK